MSYHVETTLCHDIMTYEILWQPYLKVSRYTVCCSYNNLFLSSQELGTPNDEIWPGYSQLPVVQKVRASTVVVDIPFSVGGNFQQ